MKHLKTIGRIGRLVVTRFWLVLGMAALLFIAAVLIFWTLGRNDLIVALAMALTTDTAILVTKTLYPITIVSIMLYGIWYWEGFPRFLRDESGQDIVEYALMTGFVAMALGVLLPQISALLATSLATLGVTGDMAIRICCAVMAVLLLVLIVLRRRRQTE